MTGAALAAVALGLDAALASEHLAFDALGNAVAALALDHPGLPASFGELFTAYEHARFALVSAVCGVSEVLEGQA